MAKNPTRDPWVVPGLTFKLGEGHASGVPYDPEAAKRLDVKREIRLYKLNKFCRKHPYGKKMADYPTPIRIVERIVKSDIWESHWDRYSESLDNIDTKALKVLIKALAGVKSEKVLKKRLRIWLAETYQFALTDAQMNKVIRPENR